MAKGNMLLGQARGKVGDVVFSRTNGQQVIKARAAQVKNPQTKAQMIQRIILNTVAQVYSKMQPICDHSFEGVKDGQDCMSYFMSKNTKLLRNLASMFGLDASSPLVVDLGSTDFATNPYIISKGTLPNVELTADSDYTAMGLPAGNTYEGVLSAYGLQRGDQLTFCIFDKLSNQQAQFHYARIILDPRETDGSEADLSTTFISDGVVQKANPRNENYGVEFDLNGTDLDFEAPAPRTTLSRAIIVSRRGEDGLWLRSDAQLAVSPEQTEGITIQEAYDNWLASGLDVESSKYLNNAMRMRGAVTSGAGGGESGGGTSGGGGNTDTVAAPTISFSSDSSSATVSISGPAGATIYYTQDGSVPTSASTQYSSPFTISEEKTIKAIAVKDGVSSAVASTVVTLGEEGGV